MKRILLLSDVHANFQALDTLSAFARESDLILCLGDLIGYYCQVNEVLEWMRLHKAFAVRGNHDEMLLTGRCDGMPDAVRFGIEYADRVIDPDHRRWLSTLPLVWGGFLDDSDPDARLSALLFHGSPWSPLDDYLYADSEKLSGLARFRYDLLAFGQTHRPLLKKANDVLLLNPGSVGQSRHRPAVACGATLQIRTGGFEPTLLECPYDPAPVIRLAVENGAGDWIRKHLE